MTNTNPTMTVGVVIPALNEAEALPVVLRAIPAWVSIVIVADNGSTDDTANVARANGARVVSEPIRGYGRACLTALAAMPPVDIIVFLDGDASDRPEDMSAIIAPILSGTADMVIGSRTLGRRERGSLTPQQVFGNALACWLIARIWGQKFSDLGPFRAIRNGWTVEMQVRAAMLKVPSTEVPVSYARRIGVSKVSGTIRGVFGAGTKILYVIAREAWGGLKTQNLAT
jgi:glycosyltransferase involved in cell wall biosynthesis